MANKIDDLREHLFATLAGLRDEKKPMDIDRAKAVAEVAKVIVDSAKVECDHMRIAGGTGSGFIPTPEIKVGIPRLVKGRDTRGE